MSNTRQKLLAGLFLLLGLVFMAFQFIRSLKSQPSQPNQTRPQRNNNPFALLQKIPSNWVGLAGKDDDGLLKFDTPMNGVRAGFINLYNRYFKQGLFTINQIAPVYTGLPPGKWEAYAQGLSSISGIPRDRGLIGDLESTELKKLARAIERMEAGYQWVSNTDFENGFQLAKTYIGKL